MPELRLFEPPPSIPVTAMLNSVFWAGLPFATSADAARLQGNPQQIKALLRAYGKVDADRIEFPGETQQRGGELSVTVHPALVRHNGHWDLVWDSTYRGLVAVH